ncbi:MAG: hypothetical protein E7627_07200 [Ruminococcaceae bacterium]|nr:hypothetical protein [Oscillospiraceae bacterium]
MTKNNTATINTLEEKRILGLSNAAFTLLCSFAVPFLSMIFIYCCLQVWPVGENSVLVLDLNAQYVYFLEEFREIITGGDSLIYSFNRNVGGEFMGIFAYYVSSPFSLLVALFPKHMITEALYLILVLKAGFCGLTFGFFLQRTRRMRTSHTIMFSTMYALCSFAVVMQHNLMWTDNIIAFPLILYAVDQLICHGKFKMYVITLVYCIMSNFYIGYMTCFFVLIWFFIRYFMLSPEERNPKNRDWHFAKTLLRVGIASIVAVMISAFIILPVYYSLSFGKLEFSNPDYTPKQIFDFLDMLTKAFFGSYDTVRPEGMPFIYCGTLALVIAPLYFFSKNIPTRRKIGTAVIMIVLILGFNFNIAELIWHGFQRPNWLNTRFAFMFVGIMLVMAADAFRNLSEIGSRAVMTSAALWCGMLLILDKFEYKHLPDFSAVWASILLLIIVAAAVPVFIRSAGEPVKRKISSVVLCCIVVAELLGNGVLMLYRLDEDVIISTRDSYRSVIDKYEVAASTFKDKDDTLFRADKLAHRSKNDIMALDLNGMTSSTSTLNARVIKLMGQFGFAARAHWSYYNGATAPTDALFGIKYIMTDESDSRDIPSYIYSLYDLYATTEDGIDIYENPYSLSMAFSANESVLYYDLPAPVVEGEENSVEESYTDPFTYMNELYSALLGRKVTIWTPAILESVDDVNCTRVNTVGHKGYKPDGSGNTSKLIYTVEIDDTKPLYVYFPSDYPRKVTFYLDGVKKGNYFDSKDFSITELGTYAEGEKVKVELWLTTTSLYIRKDVDFFWYFDEQAYVDAVTELADGVMVAHSNVDHKIWGDVTVPAGDSVMFTSIPYDKGWEVKVDGKVVEAIPVLNDTLTAFEITEGEHHIEFTYKSPYVIYGGVLSIIGLVLFAAWWVLDSIFGKKRRTAEVTAPHPDLKIHDEDYFPILTAEIEYAVESTVSEAATDEIEAEAEDGKNEDNTEESSND